MTQPAEWGRRFQELAADAGKMYTHVLHRYNELLDRVAKGELKPEAVQKEFREHLEEQGASSTRELVELSVGLLTGLLYIEAKYREALLDGLLPSDEPIPPPPSSSSIDLTNWFQTLSKYAAEQSARGIARQQELVERIASGQISPDKMQEQGRRYLEAHAPRFVGEVMELGLTFVGRLQHSSTSLAEGLYDRVLGPDPESSPTPDPPLIVDLRGEAGSAVTAEIVVENTRAEPATVVCRISEFTTRGGERSFASGAETVPARFTLAPGESRDIALSLPLDRSFFRPGTDYFATLRVSGAGDRDMVVQLIAKADPPKPPATAKSTRAARHSVSRKGKAR